MNTSRACAAALGLLLLPIGACATSRARTGGAQESAIAADPRHGIPPATPEADPDVTEARFGFGEARVRREEKARAEAAAHQNDHLDAAKVEEPPPAAPAKTEAPAAKAPCPCKTESPPKGKPPDHAAHH